MTRSNRQGPERPAAGDGHIAGSEVELLRSTSDETLDYLVERTREMFDRIARDRAERDATAVMFGASEAERAYEAALSILNEHRSVIESTFASELQRVRDAFLTGRRHRATEESGATSAQWELAILDDSRLEEQLAVDGLVGRARRQYEDVLHRIDVRLRKLAVPHGLHPGSHPADPKPVCDAFARAVQGAEAELNVKLKMLSVFERFVTGELAQLYDQVDGALSPHADASMGAQSAAARPVRGEGGAPEHGSTDDDDSTPRAAPARDEPAAAGGEVSGAGVRVVSASGSEIAAEDLLRLVQRATGDSVRRGDGSGGDGDGGASDAAPIGVNELVSALGRLQQDPGYQPDASGQQADLKAHLLEGIRSEVGEEGASGIAESEENTIDLVSVLFDYVLQDSAIPESIKGLVARLQMPVVKVALLEPEFFSSDSHPARELINSIGHAAVGMDAAEQAEAEAVTEEVRKVVEWISTQFDRDILVFEAARQEFEQRLEEVRASALTREREAVDALAQEEERAAADRLASESINELIGDNDLPEVIDGLLRVTWKDLLASVYLRHGSASQPFKRVLNVASLLIWSLLPKSTRAERNELVSELPRLLRAIRSGMARMRLDDESQERILAILAEEHARNARGLRAGAAGSEQQPATGTEAERTGSVVTGCPGDARAGDADDAPCTGGDGDTEPALGRAGAEAESSDGGGSDKEPAAPLETARSTDDRLEADKRTFIERKVAQIDRMVTERRWRQPPAPSVDAEGDAEKDRLIRQVHSMKTGTWLELQDREDGLLHAKLAWKGNISGDYYFFDRRGFQVAAIGEGELVEGMRAGTISLLEKAPVVDRALDAMVSQLGGDVAVSS